MGRVMGTSRPVRRSVSLTITTLVVLGGVGVVVAAAPGASASLAGCAVSVTHENPTNDAIQAAINAHPGGKICVGPGTFPEQLVISSSNTTLAGAGPSQTTIAPNAPLQFNTFNYDAAGGPTAVPAAAIILVQGVSGTPSTHVGGVMVSGLTVNGAPGSASFSNCSYGFYGVDFQASSGSLVRSTVRAVAMPPSLFGCQTGTGLAVLAYNGYVNFGLSPTALRVNITQTSVLGYQKNGITCKDPLESCRLLSDTVQGIGPTTLTAQNGVEIAFGALGFVKGCRVSGNSYIGGTSTNDWYANGWSASGILLYDPAAGTTLRGNPGIARNQIGIALFDDGLSAHGYQGPVNVTIVSNVVKSSDGYGIALNGAPGGLDAATLQSNLISNLAALNPAVWGAPGILVDTGHFLLVHNAVLGATGGPGSSNGASQIVCGPDANNGTGTPLLACAANESVPTAAVEGVSENVSNPTFVRVLQPIYLFNAGHRVSTLGVLGGTVNLVLGV